MADIVLVSDLRNEYVDYTDNTINELRYNNDGKLDRLRYYPLGNIYPYGKLPYLYVNNDAKDKTTTKIGRAHV